MAKFGDLIHADIPILIIFFAHLDEPEQEHNDVLQTIAATLGDKAKVIKIDIEKNATLVKALMIEVNPTYIIYKKGEMKWRQTGNQDAATLIDLVQQYL
ncbi:MAG: thiol reductase thioredoxin [Flavobacteriales bacterium CG03_land_8_20_14_0_80_35_15]|nr:thioredoxin [Zetaproteobacteria bacterium]OIO12510.1 MAG: thiol reductase thioredoxin [Flavobacteriaceae bacterium CG1_02_35_72]PIR14480.1 MAG: thiol reductase thioredoxin [Flavobacteriales bacterium CG11_big_fil_rev_8_21_14_0_20_35_7]PIV16859.1 MAG: thiol reductase thioredoxin [Flavobacteriales bacterium CG03_land_8_20_14_0_80_35_15]PIX06160.1 MAG: thiol reductase thioredoxin [Flavobacteriales bacterium CG_4_8_14_3_um_filter_35_10]PJA06735.1 MAG: thiol reductase thioredoxin [Flavobacterial